MQTDVNNMLVARTSDGSGGNRRGRETDKDKVRDKQTENRENLLIDDSL